LGTSGLGVAGSSGWALLFGLRIPSRSSMSARVRCFSVRLRTTLTIGGSSSKTGM
jgi:hypothetical protein